jgi:hypothetical protein
MKAEHEYKTGEKLLLYPYSKQHPRIATILWGDGITALIEYQMPGGTSGLRLYRKDKHWTRLSYGDLPKWLYDALKTNNTKWIGKPQGGTHKPGTTVLEKGNVIFPSPGDKFVELEDAPNSIRRGYHLFQNIKRITKHQDGTYTIYIDDREEMWIFDKAKDAYINLAKLYNDQLYKGLVKDFGGERNLIEAAAEVGIYL